MVILSLLTLLVVSFKNLFGFLLLLLDNDLPIDLLGLLLNLLLFVLSDKPLLFGPTVNVALMLIDVLQLFQLHLGFSDISLFSLLTHNDLDLPSETAY